MSGRSHHLVFHRPYTGADLATLRRWGMGWRRIFMCRIIGLHLRWDHWVGAGMCSRCGSLLARFEADR